MLSLIKEKEFEIKAEIVKTRQKAAEIVENAKLKAKEMIEKSRERAQKDAENLYLTEIEKAKEQAQRIVKDAEKQALRLEKEFNNLLDEASSFVASLILGESEFKQE